MKTKARLLFVSRIILSVAVLSNLSLALMVTADINGGSRDFFTLVSWGNFTFWLLIMGSLFGTSFSKLAIEHPAFWIIASVITGFISMLLPTYIFYTYFSHALLQTLQA